MQRTFVMLKPDAVTRGLIGEVVARFERRGLRIVGMKMVRMDEKLCKTHYAHHAGKSFFPSLIRFMTSTPVVCLVLEGKQAIEVVRKMCGSTNAREAEPGTIRGDYSLSTQVNIIHASDTPEMAEAEIARFFRPDELFDYELPFVQYAEDELVERRELVPPRKKHREEP
ncbi:MAG: nucleoside-diphosphate kinase [Candidatus Micrarchaeia archaeon]